ALDLQELPRIDLILISHAHMEHLDLRSLAGFSSSTPTVTASNTSDLCRRAGLRNVTELHWGEITLAKTPAGEVVVEAFEVKHWGRRWPDKFDRGYNGYLLRRGGRSLLFAGDTAYTSSFAQLRSRGPFEIGFMPIGAYHPWIRNHCTPEQAVQMADMAGVIRIVPIHHGTFKLSDEPMEEPLRRFEQALADQPERIGLRYVGESIALGNADSVRKEASPRG
ncbi:MAG: MBL fold metallo-hydrolase, partial [Verrucomicrobiae bacterium]|nr:MBL fold metallo-hydrolase [Verrucomicrobiae bacterium]